METPTTPLDIRTQQDAQRTKTKKTHTKHTGGIQVLSKTAEQRQRQREKKTVSES